MKGPLTQTDTTDTSLIDWLPWSAEKILKQIKKQNKNKTTTNKKKQNKWTLPLHIKKWLLRWRRHRIATSLWKWALTVFSLLECVAQSWGGAGIVDSADFKMICRIGENQRDLRLRGVDPLTWGLSWCFTNGHTVAIMQLFGRKLTNGVNLAAEKHQLWLHGS